LQACSRTHDAVSQWTAAPPSDAHRPRHTPPVVPVLVRIRDPDPQPCSQHVTNRGGMDAPMPARSTAVSDAMVWGCAASQPLQGYSGFERSWCRRQLCDPRKGSTRRPPVPHTIHQSRPSAMPTESCLGTPRNVGFDRLAADGKAGNAGAARGVHTKFSSPSPDGTFGLALASRALTPHTQIRRGRSCHHPAAPPHAHHTSSATFTLAPRPPSSSLRPFPRPQRRAISTQGFIPRRWSATPLRHKQPHESPPLDPHRPEARPIPETPSCLSEP